MSLIDTEPATPTLPLAPATEADRLSISPLTWASPSSAAERDGGVVGEGCGGAGERVLGVGAGQAVTALLGRDGDRTGERAHRKFVGGLEVEIRGLGDLGPVGEEGLGVGIDVVDRDVGGYRDTELALPDLLAPAALPLPSWVSLASAGISVCALLSVASAPATE